MDIFSQSSQDENIPTKINRNPVVNIKQKYNSNLIIT